MRDKAQNINVLNENNKVRPMTRRQKHKADKIKKKYGDQDDEERQLRLMLLASKPKDSTNFESLFVTLVTPKEFSSSSVIRKIHFLIGISFAFLRNVSLNPVFVVEITLTSVLI